MRVKYIKRKTIEIYYSHYKLKANCYWCFLLIGGEQNLWQFDSYIIGAIIGLFYKETTSGTTVVAFIRFYWSYPIPAMFHLQRPNRHVKWSCDRNNHPESLSFLPECSIAFIVLFW